GQGHKEFACARCVSFRATLMSRLPISSWLLSFAGCTNSRRSESPRARRNAALDRRRAASELVRPSAVRLTNEGPPHVHSATQIAGYVPWMLVGARCSVL